MGKKDIGMTEWQKCSVQVVSFIQTKIDLNLGMDNYWHPVFFRDVMTHTNPNFNAI